MCRLYDRSKDQRLNVLTSAMSSFASLMSFKTRKMQDVVQKA